MVATAQDLLLEFNPVTAYTQSDEISLVFPAVKKTKEDEGKTLPFGGRVLKLCTLAASYCSIRFNFHCMKNKHKWDPSIKNYDKVMEKLSSCEAHFDARVFNLDSEEDVLRNIMWRSTYDCVRNSKSRLAHVHVPQKEIQGKSSKELVDLMIKSYNVDWHSFPNAFKYGTYLKRVHVDKEGFKYEKGVKTDEKIIVKRTMVKTFSFTMDKFSKQHLDFLFCKILEDSQ